jgi:hypothetical protein
MAVALGSIESKGCIQFREGIRKINAPHLFLS